MEKRRIAGLLCAVVLLVGGVAFWRFDSEESPVEPKPSAESRPIGAEKRPEQPPDLTTDTGQSEDPPQVELLSKNTLPIEGRVTDTRGALLRGASVSAKGITALSGQDGAYQITGLDDCGGYPFGVTATLESYGRQAQFVRFERGPAKGLSGIDFVLGREAVLSGHVIDTLGRPQAGEKLRLLHVAEVKRAGAGLGFVITGPDGAFHIDSVGEGLYSFLLMSITVAQGQERVRGARPSLNDILRVHEGDVITDLEVVVPAYEETGINGRVYDNAGTPVADLLIKGRGNEGGLSFAATDSSGGFQVVGLMGQFAELIVGGQMTFTHVPLGETGMEIVLPGTGGIEGRLVKSTGHPGVPGAGVKVTRICSLDDPTVELQKLEASLEWREAVPGGFEFHEVPEGIVTLLAEAPGFGPIVVDVEVRAGVVTRIGDIVFPQASVLQGAVVRDGEAIPGEEVRVWLSWEGTQLRCPVDEQGRFRRDDLPEGTLQLTAMCRARHQMRHLPVELTAGGSTTVMVDFGGMTATVAGTVSAEYEFSGIYVCLGDRFDQALRFENISTIESFIEQQTLAFCILPPMTGGDFELESIPPGSYYLTALGLRDAHYGGREWAIAEQAVDVSSGQTLFLEMALE